MDINKSDVEDFQIVYENLLEIEFDNFSIFKNEDNGIIYAQHIDEERYEDYQIIEENEIKENESIIVFDEEIKTNILKQILSGV